MKTTIRRIQNKVIKPNLKSPIQFFNSIMKLKINAMKHQLLSLLSAHSNANLQKLIPGLTNKSSSCCISCSIYFTSTYGTRLPTSHEQRNAGAWFIFFLVSKISSNLFIWNKKFEFWQWTDCQHTPSSENNMPLISLTTVQVVLLWERFCSFIRVYYVHNSVYMLCK